MKIDEIIFNERNMIRIFIFLILTFIFILYTLSLLIYIISLILFYSVFESIIYYLSINQYKVINNNKIKINVNKIFKNYINKKDKIYFKYFIIIKIFEIFFILLIIIIMCEYCDNFLINYLDVTTNTFNIKYITILLYIYFISSLIMCFIYANIMKFACINSLVGKYKISWITYFASTGISMFIHIILIIQFGVPVIFARIIGFAIDLTIFDSFITWIEPNLKVNASLFDFSVKQVNYTKNINLNKSKK